MIPWHKCFPRSCLTDRATEFKFSENQVKTKQFYIWSTLCKVGEGEHVPPLHTVTSHGKCSRRGCCTFRERIKPLPLPHPLFNLTQKKIKSNIFISTTLCWELLIDFFRQHHLTSKLLTFYPPPQLWSQLQRSHGHTPSVIKSLISL